MAKKKQIIAITTKTGDRGESGLANGVRLSKADVHFEVVGNLDELNSWLGLVVVKIKQFSDLLNLPNDQKDSSDTLSVLACTEFLEQVQDTLFYIGAEIARSPKAILKKSALDVLEKNSSQLGQVLADDWHTRFILPGGTELGSWLDITRTVCRRAERSMVLLQQQSAIDLDKNQLEFNPMLVKYLNRLSDYLYLLRCFFNDQLGYDEKEFQVKS
jgi:cob(I)alamin adenosyltransferase